MTHVSSVWPVFVLVGVLVGERHYAKRVVPAVQRLKQDYGLPPDVPLHSRAIRRWDPPFDFLRDTDVKQAFYTDISSLFTRLQLRLFSVVIDKRRLASRYLLASPYDISISQLLSLVCGSPGMPAPWRPNVARIVAESRGRREDKELQREFQAFRQRGLHNYGAEGVSRRTASTVNAVYPDKIRFLRKSLVVAGLELADLAAYPIGRAAVDNNWDNPAYLVLATRLGAPVVLFP